MAKTFDHSMEEKGDFSSASQVENALSPISSDLNIDEVYSHEEQRKIVHRIDRRLVTVLGLMYCISLMDRTNLSAAALAGMNDELEMAAGTATGFRYSIVALVFFITYTLCQPPATLLTRKIGPRIFLPMITLLWGSIMIGFGFVPTWTTLVGLRILLGILEAGFFPGCVYLLSTWYSRYDVHKRYSVFYLIGASASAFSGILAFGIEQMDGLGGLSGWRWIFIVEGIISCVIALLGAWLLVDFPEHAARNGWRFLSADECGFIIRRINKDRSDAIPESFTLARFLRPALDLKIWGFALIFGCTTTGTYSISYFLPLILHDSMGFSIGASQCLVAPPYALAGIVMFATAALGDKYRIRGPIIVFHSLLAIIGLPLMGYSTNNVVRYFGVFLVTASLNANVPSAMAYQANNIRGQWKRAFCSASLVGMGGIGGIAGSTVFRSQDAPAYVPGIWACLTANFLILAIVGVSSIYFAKCNRKADREGYVIEGQEGFRYTL